MKSKGELSNLHPNPRQLPQPNLIESPSFYPFILAHQCHLNNPCAKIENRKIKIKGAATQRCVSERRVFSFRSHPPAILTVVLKGFDSLCTHFQGFLCAIRFFFRFRLSISLILVHFCFWFLLADVFAESVSTDFAFFTLPCPKSVLLFRVSFSHSSYPIQCVFLESVCRTFSACQDLIIQGESNRFFLNVQYTHNKLIQRHALLRMNLYFVVSVDESSSWYSFCL